MWNKPSPICQYVDAYKKVCFACIQVVGNVAKKPNYMKKALIFLIWVMISCNSTKEISNWEKEKITSELDYIYNID